MKPLAVLVLLLLSLFPVQAQETAQRFLHRYNLRISENGRYRGLTFGGGRGVIRPVSGPQGTVYRVNYLLEEETVRDRTHLEKFVEEERVFDYRLAPGGRLVSTGRFPFHEGFPTFPETGITPNAVWVGKGAWTVRPRNDRPETRIPVLIEYREAGTGQWGGRDVIVVTGLYALRYRRGQDPQGDPELNTVQGRHEMALFVDLLTQKPLFLRLSVSEQFAWTDGTTREQDGFHLIWMEGVPPLDAPTPPHVPTLPRVASVPGAIPTEGTPTHPLVATLPRNAPELAGNESAGPGDPIPPTLEELPIPNDPSISIERTERGIVLVPESLLFVADRADLLPNQESKLEAIVRLLHSRPDRGIQVVGHTADVGLPSEELKLSRERAQKVAEFLIQMGLPARRFYIEGRGATDPRVRGITEAQRAQNRRVEIILRDD